MKPGVESIHEGVPWQRNLGNMQMEAEREGQKEGGKKNTQGGDLRCIMAEVERRSRGSVVNQERWGRRGSEQQSIRFLMHMNDQLLALL